VKYIDETKQKCVKAMDNVNPSTEMLWFGLRKFEKIEPGASIVVFFVF